MSWKRPNKNLHDFINESAIVEDNNTIHCPDVLPKRKEGWYVFLAGPVQGTYDWRGTMPKIDNVTYLSPARTNYDNFDYVEQVEWEKKMMSMADIILFWIPESTINIPGREYAQTTRTEFGEYLGKGKRVIIGISKDTFPGYKYFKSKTKQYSTPSFEIKLHSTLEDTINNLKEYIKSCDNNPRTFFVSDTHFGSDRARTLSKRPFETVELMDWAMIERWNNNVNPNDVVIHAGDFGNYSVLQYLNYKTISLIFGNYEYTEAKERGHLTQDYADMLKQTYPIDEIYIEPIKYTIDTGDIQEVVCIGHEPITTKEQIKKLNLEDDTLCIFGHIHGRQKIKKFGIDVGVDGNNYTPVSDDEVLFYINAIRKGYYDDEVWVQ